MGEDSSSPVDRLKDPNEISINMAARIVAKSLLVGATGAALYTAAKGPDHPFKPEATPVLNAITSDHLPAEIDLGSVKTPEELKKLLRQLAGVQEVDNETVISMYWPGVVVFPAGAEIPRTPGQGETKPYVVPKGKRMVVFSPREASDQHSDYLNMSEPGATKARATDPKVNLFEDLDSAGKYGEFYQFEHQPGTVDEGGVDANGNPTLPHMDASRVMSSVLIDDGSWLRFQKLLNLHKATELPSG